jgi:hypothetical protein
MRRCGYVYRDLIAGKREKKGARDRERERDRFAGGVLKVM